MSFRVHRWLLKGRARGWRIVWACVEASIDFNYTPWWSQWATRKTSLHFKGQVGWQDDGGKLWPIPRVCDIASSLASKKSAHESSFWAQSDEPLPLTCVGGGDSVWENTPVCGLTKLPFCLEQRWVMMSDRGVRNGIRGAECAKAALTKTHTKGQIEGRLHIHCMAHL